MKQEHKKAAKALVNMILDSEDFTELRMPDIKPVLLLTETILQEFFNQLSLRQAKEYIESLPEDEIISRAVQVQKGFYKA